MGKKVRNPNGEYLGVINGIHQTKCNGCFDEVCIENGHGPMYMPLASLLPDGDGYILLQGAPGPEDLLDQAGADVPLAKPLPSANGAIEGTIPIALPAMPADENIGAGTTTVLIHNVGSSVSLPPATISSQSPSLRNQFNRAMTARRSIHLTTPLVFQGEVRGVVANLEPPKPRDRSRKKKSKKHKGNRESSKRRVTVRGARSLFNISTILQFGR